MPSVVGRARQPGPPKWLLGTWKSNRDKTLENWVFPPGRKGLDLRRVLATTFGLLTFRFTSHRIHTRFDAPNYPSRSDKVVNPLMSQQRTVTHC